MPKKRKRWDQLYSTGFMTQGRGLPGSPIPQSFILKAVLLLGPPTSHIQFQPICLESHGQRPPRITRPRRRNRKGRWSQEHEQSHRPGRKHKCHRSSSLLQRLVTLSGSSCSQWIVSHYLLEMHFKPFKFGTSKDSGSLF